MRRDMGRSSTASSIRSPSTVVRSSTPRGSASSTGSTSSEKSSRSPRPFLAVRRRSSPAGGLLRCSASGWSAPYPIQPSRTSPNLEQQLTPDDRGPGQHRQRRLRRRAGPPAVRGPVRLEVPARHAVRFCRRRLLERDGHHHAFVPERELPPGSDPRSPCELRPACSQPGVEQPERAGQ